MPELILHPGAGKSEDPGQGARRREGSGPRVPYLNGIGGVAASAALDDWAKDEEVRDEIDSEEGGWDLDVTAADAHGDQQEASEEFDEVADLEQALARD